jgi:hypothetical protein
MSTQVNVIGDGDGPDVTTVMDQFVSSAHAVGSELGASEGIILGASDGINDGSLDGALDGFLLGWSEMSITI